MTLARDLIKLAKENPELRPALASVLKQAGSFSQVQREAVRAMRGLPKPKSRADAIKNMAGAVIKTPAVMNWFYDIWKEYGSITYNNTQDMLGDAAWAYRGAWELDDDYGRGSKYEGLSGDTKLVKLLNAAAKKYKPTKVDLGRDYGKIRLMVDRWDGLNRKLQKLENDGHNEKVRKEALAIAKAVVKALS